MTWDSLFHSKAVLAENLESLDEVRQAFATLASVLERNLPGGRYKSIVKTLLEQTASMATKAFTHNEAL